MNNSAPFLILWLLCVPIMAILREWIGSKLPRRGDWLVWLGLLITVGGFLIQWVDHSNEATLSEAWIKNWIVVGHAAETLRVGVVIDGPGLLMSLILLLVSGFYLLAYALNEDQNPEHGQKPRSIMALAISCVGACLAWISATPMNIIVGLSLCLVGQTIHASASWNRAKTAVELVNYSWTTVLGLVFCMIGVSILGEQQQFLLGMGLGRFFCLMGAGMIYQLFPFTGWIHYLRETRTTTDQLLGMFFPMVAISALLFRLYGSQGGSEVFSLFGTLFGVLTIVSGVIGVFQRKTNACLSAWISVGFGLFASVLLRAGGTVAFLLLLGLMMWIPLAPLVFVEPEKVVERKREKFGWVYFIHGFIMSGVFGTIAANGIVALLLFDRMPSVYLGTSIVQIFFFSLVLFRMVWRQVEFGFVPPSKQIVYIYSGIFLLCTLSVWWTGDFFGGLFPEHTLRLFDNLSTKILETGKVFKFDQANGEAPMFLPDGIVIVIHLGIVLFAILISYLLSKKQEDVLVKLQAKAPRFYQFVSSGFASGQALGHVRSSLIYAGRGLSRYIDEVLWENKLPKVINSGLRWGAKGFMGFGEIIWRGLIHGIGVAVQAPAKGVELIQRGDVQWYLMFGLATGMALLLHFGLR